MAAWCVVEDGRRGRTQHWDRSQGANLPAELVEALEDPDVEKWAFNAEFERVITKRVGKIKTPYRGWRCTMAKAAMHSFTGGLLEIGRQMGLPESMLKSTEGEKLIKLFCMPQRITKANQHEWRNWETDPDAWERFCQYNIQDVAAEVEIYDRLAPFPIWDTAWDEYALDQRINDRGIPVDVELCEAAVELAALRKRELVEEMREYTDLQNPNSPKQLLPWLKERGYRFDDLEKNSVLKVMSEHEESIKSEPYASAITQDCYEVLKRRRHASRTSVTKYTAFTKKMGRDGRFRFNTKFGGASRTFRWSGRGVQMQNLHRTPKFLEPKDGNDYWLVTATDAIRNRDYDLIKLLAKEPMDLLAGCVRGAFRAPEGKVIRACDLASIESVVIGWLARCERLLNVFRSGRCAYRDFATELFHVLYEEVTSAMRTLAKPATLGAGYRLGGGSELKGKKTGLWGYAEGMGIKMTRQQAHESVELWRETYEEIVQLWYDLEKAVGQVLRMGGEREVGPVKFHCFDKEGRRINGPTGNREFLCAVLPSGRRLYYHKPRLEKKTFVAFDKKTGKPKIDPETGEKETYERTVFTYMGKHPDTMKWTRIDSHGGKLTENLVQAIARDILQLGLFAAHDAGFDIRLHVHDEIDTVQDEDDDVHTTTLLRECMIQLPPWAQDIPLNAAAGEFRFYRKE